MKLLSDIALEFEGVQEIPENQGFKDQFLSSIMDASGFKKGYAWCMLFVKVCSSLYLTQFDSGLIERYEKCFTPGAVSSFNNFKEYYPEMVSNKPELNSIAIWQKYIDNKPVWMGHAGIVVSINGDSLTTVDGNTNHKGNREGDGVYVQHRNIRLQPENGLRLRGFINLPNGYV